MSVFAQPVPPQLLSPRTAVAKSASVHAPRGLWGFVHLHSHPHRPLALCMYLHLRVSACFLLLQLSKL